MNGHTGNLRAEIERLSSMKVSDLMDETKLSLVFPAKTRTGVPYIRSMDLAYDTHDFGTGGGIHYRWAGVVKTKQMRVAYCWSTRRNKAGYFLGWRQVERNAIEGHIVRDQLVARKSKKRLKVLQTKRTEKLRLQNTP